MSDTLQQQAEALYRVVSEFARNYQFRDRDQICRHDVSVTQCYALDLVDSEGSMTMGTLAAGLQLDLSTVTRTVDQLVQMSLVKRESDPADRRVCRIRCTAKGKQRIEKIRSELIDKHKAILSQLTPEARSGAIKAISLLLDAFNKCCDDDECS